MPRAWKLHCAHGGDGFEMGLDGAPSREVACERRPRSNTPVQALVTLNDPAFLAAANALAERIIGEGGKDAKQRLAFAFKCCLAREPNPKEASHLLELYQESRRRFAAAPATAVALASIDETESMSDADAVEFAAWTVISNVLLNLDETLTKG
jgi:hypothetical protein